VLNSKAERTQVGPREVSMSRQQHDVERYRAAAYAALDQLDWIIKFLHRIQKSKIAHGLEQNRRTIIRRHGLVGWPSNRPKTRAADVR
jgi:hypothetical protein